MDLSKYSINKIRIELWTCHILCEQRCLRKSCEWAEDLLWALPEEGEQKLLAKLDKDFNDLSKGFDAKYEHAKACFELHEYDRAAHLIRDHKFEPKARFLHYFAKYKAAEKKRIDLMNDVSINMPRGAILKYNELRDSLERSMDKKDPDGWLFYVYGLVLHKFRLNKIAIEVLEKAIRLTPINWSAWYVLSTLIDSAELLHSLSLPNHLFKVFFYQMVRLELELPTSIPWAMVGFKETKNFIDKYFKSSLFIKTLTAKYLGHQSSKYREAMDIFAQIRTEDPYRVDSTEIYSNFLYVRRMRKELSRLAYEIERVDPFTLEANSCIANSFSAREQHTKAIVYFTRALRLHPDHLNSWTLIGHEYLAMKSIDKASQAYRFAISINKRDCRAWLGLGNTSETIMSGPNVANPNYDSCLYYYSQVGKYRPKDHIMFMAMGNIYEKMNEIDKAIACISKAGQEGLFKLAKLYDADGRRVQAAETYKKWLKHLENVKDYQNSHSDSALMQGNSADDTGNNSNSFKQISATMTSLSEYDDDVAHARAYIEQVERSQKEAED